MTSATLIGLCAAALAGLGLYGLIVQAQALRKILSFNVLGGGVFLLLGVVARRGGTAGVGGDPIPQALAITGIVVAFASTALAVALLRQLANKADSASGEPSDPKSLSSPDVAS